MLHRLNIASVVLALPLLAFAQTVQQINNQTDLARALCDAQTRQETRASLLQHHRQLVDRKLWDEIMGRAANAYYQESPERALRIYDVSIEIATTLSDPQLLARTYYNLGGSYSGINQLENAIRAYERSRENFEQAGLRRDLIYVLADLGAIYFNQENYQRAKEYSEQSILIADSVKLSDDSVGTWPDDFGRARALHTLAEIDLRNGNHEAAIDKLEQSLGMYQALRANNSYYDFFIAGIFATLGKVYPETGDYARALFYLNKALDLARASSDRDTIANILNSIGYLYLEQEDYAQAKEHFDRSLKIYVANNNDIEASKVLLNLGVIEQRQAHYDEALAHFKRSSQAAKATQIADIQIAAGEGIGVVLTAQGKLTEALVILNEGLDLARQTRNKTREIELTWRSAQTLFDMRNYGEAATRAEAAVLLAQSAHLPKLEYLATTTLGQVYAAQGKIDLAEQTLSQAISQLERLRMQVAGRETASQLYFENKLAPYHALIDILTKQGKPLDALLLAERAKARVLLDVVSGNKVDASKVLTPTEKQELIRLNRNLADINDRIKSQNGNTSATDSLYARLDSARQEYQAYQDALYVIHPDLRIRSGRTAAVNRADIDDLTENNSAYLEYVVTKDRVSLFVITKDASNASANVRVHQIETTPSELISKVNQFHDRLANRHPDYATLAHELYSLLISPAEEQVRDLTLCIVPDSFIWNLPFQALITKRGRFLIEEHPLYYAPSLSVLREIGRRNSTGQKSDNSLIAFGNPVIGRDEQRNKELCPLPEAETEVNSIAKSFDPKGRRVFIGREASEKSFRVLAPTFTTVHLATHGVLDNRQPLYSHLLLTKTEGDVENDGLLEAREIMNMNLKADLAVLSACETANGRLAPGEGVMGMSWAFFIAGTRSMLVSQWKVNSASTSQLMVNFYQALASSQNNVNGNQAKALQDAALKTMKDQRYRHPFYWAAFVLVGKA